MKLKSLAATAFLFSFLTLAAGQKEQPQQHEEKKPEQQEEPQQRPTLGAPSEPSLNGPRSSTTNDARKLMRVRTIYVEHMDNRLGEKLADGLSKQGRFRVVASRGEADAVLHGTCFDSRRLKSVHSEVYLADRSGTAIWQDVIRRQFNPPALEKVVDSTAAEIVQHLGDSVREADRKQ